MMQCFPAAATKKSVKIYSSIMHHDIFRLPRMPEQNRSSSFDRAVLC